MFTGLGLDQGLELAANASSTACNTTSNYMWANNYFSECVHNDKQLAGLIFGLLSILCWIVAQGPQLYRNFKTSTAEGLSGLFLADWLAGDITNLIGCILTKQVPTQLYTAIWFCFIDTSMCLQWLYYEKYKRKKTAPHVVASTTYNTMGAGIVVTVALATVALVALTAGPAEAEEARPAGRVLLEIHSFHGTRNIVGWTIGWISGLLYFTSRIPQIVKNFRRRSTDGLSVAMFIMAILGNTTYALGVLLESSANDFIIDHLPWLIGSVGTLIFDFTIALQFLMFGSEDEKEELSDRKPLLQSA
ncbi:uncharacterized protein MONBRDRAFT_33670 [Monosiga brevicollis MX1]|uniref:Uncharacterized protein n=1 Tax=Monosiga brevicollis TaxID=81824 RepID=A9V6G9_MONBE|nr:uncharacterized protein MONBRDRAFT_33670 [Monosiga brevicollis MX1]EDQ86881.1 predicted protein [Monosiga brevicollis MX1]|eukprot:XP_001748426.1 hypothetical protein [Monosiga brevicollis MX1]